MKAWVRVGTMGHMAISPERQEGRSSPSPPAQGILLKNGTASWDAKMELWRSVCSILAIRKQRRSDRETLWKEEGRHQADEQRQEALDGERKKMEELRPHRVGKGRKVQAEEEQQAGRSVFASRIGTSLLRAPWTEKNHLSANPRSRCFFPEATLVKWAVACFDQAMITSERLETSIAFAKEGRRGEGRSLQRSHRVCPRECPAEDPNGAHVSISMEVGSDVLPTTSKTLCPQST